MKRNDSPLELRPLHFVAFFFYAVLAALTVLFSRGITDCWPREVLIPVSIGFGLSYIVWVYLLFMWVYLKIVRRFVHRKYLAEFFTVAIAFLFSVASKMTYAYNGSSQGWGEASFELNRLLSSLYAAIGGLQFEGIQGLEPGAQALRVIDYYGSSIVAGAVFFSVIASQAFYEFYCHVSIWFRYKKNKNIYIFTALNEETLNIARSISEQEDEKKAKRSIIIFAGPALKPFDRHDPDCAEVTANDYLYIPFSAKKESNDPNKKRETLLHRLHLTPWLWFRRPKWAEAHVFAFDSDDDHIPNEEENMDYVIMDARNTLFNLERGHAMRRQQSLLHEYRELCKKKERYKQFIHDLDGMPEGDAKTQLLEHARISILGPDFEENKTALEERLWKHRYSLRKFKKTPPPVTYYILTTRKINYQSYIAKIEELDNEFSRFFRAVSKEAFDAFTDMEEKRLGLEEAKRKYDEACLDPAPTFANIFEAKGSWDEKKDAYDKEREKFHKAWTKHKPFTIYVWNEADAIAHEAQRFLLEESCYALPNQNLSWVACYGFGATGQSLAKMLFSYTANVNDEGKAADYYCEVYDPDGIKKLAGIVQMEIPCSVVLTDDDLKHVPPDPEKKVAEVYREKRANVIDKIYRSYKDATDEKKVSPNDRYCFYLSNWHGSIEGFLAAQTFKECEQKFRAHYSALASELVSKEAKDIQKEIPVPCFLFHDKAIGNKDATAPFVPSWEPRGQFYQRFDGANGLVMPDYLVVSVGDDYENIRIVNGIIDFFLKDTLPENQRKRITVFVNVWDEKNNNLITGYSDGRLKDISAGIGDETFSRDPGQIIAFPQADYLRVIIIGNNADIYKFSEIEPSSRAMQYNGMYGSMFKRQEGKDGSDVKKTFVGYAKSIALHFSDSRKVYEADSAGRPYPEFSGNAEMEKKLLTRAMDSLAKLGDDLEEALASWKGLDLWRRRSSLEATLFGSRYLAEMKFLKDKKPCLTTFLALESRIEHQRWMRLHIGEGWVYSWKRNDKHRMHPSLLPYGMMPWRTSVNDLGNVYLGVLASMKERDDAERKMLAARLPALREAKAIDWGVSDAAGAIQRIVACEEEQCHVMMVGSNVLIRDLLTEIINKETGDFNTTQINVFCGKVNADIPLTMRNILAFSCGKEIISDANYYPMKAGKMMVYFRSNEANAIDYAQAKCMVLATEDFHEGHTFIDALLATGLDKTIILFTSNDELETYAKLRLNEKAFVLRPKEEL